MITADDTKIWKVSRAFQLIGSGTTPRSSEAKYFDNGNINWLITGDLNDGEVKETSKKITSLALADYSTLKTYPANSLVIAMYGATIAKLGLLTVPTTVNQACCVLVPSKRINPRYAFYYFLSSKRRLIDLAYGGGQPNISQDTIRSFKITLPSMLGQGKMVDYLDEKAAIVDKMIASKNHTHTQLSELRTAIIDTAILEFGVNDLQSLKRVTVFVNRGASPDYSDDGEVSFINQACIYRDGIKMTAIKKAVKASHPSGSRGYLHKGDLLVNSTGTGTLGRVTVFEIDNNGTYFADSHVTIVRPDLSKVNQKYLRYVMDSSKFQDEVYTNCVTGSTNQIELSRERFRELVVPVPSLEGQQKIVDELGSRLKRVDSSDEILKKSISQLEEYRTSLISNVISGKVEV